jgi:hypothetical protein
MCDERRALAGAETKDLVSASRGLLIKAPRLGCIIAADSGMTIFAKLKTVLNV